MQEKSGFFRNHADTLAIIGVNLAVAGILLAMIISDSSRIDCCNSRIDHTYTLIYDLLKEIREKRN